METQELLGYEEYVEASLSHRPLTAAEKGHATAHETED